MLSTSHAPILNSLSALIEITNALPSLSVLVRLMVFLKNSLRLSQTSSSTVSLVMLARPTSPDALSMQATSIVHSVLDFCAPLSSRQVVSAKAQLHLAFKYQATTSSSPSPPRSLVNSSQSLPLHPLYTSLFSTDSLLSTVSPTSAEEVHDFPCSSRRTTTLRLPSCII